MEIREKLWLLGPSRRSEKTVFEQQFIFSNQEQQALELIGEALFTELAKQLDQAGIDIPPIQQDFESQDNAGLTFCKIFTRLAIALQQAGGHRVVEQDVVEDRQGQGYWAWFEYEHDAVAAAAVLLSLKILVSLDAALSMPDMEGEAIELQDESFSGFLAVARTRVLPVDTEAIIRAALARNVPCVKLDRAPYQGVQGAFRIRQNGLLKLGHCAHQLIVDGTICVSRSGGLLPMLQSRAARHSVLTSLQLPLPKVDPEAGNCALSKHALRSAEKIGYPVGLSVTASNGQVYHWPDIAGADELRKTLDVARQHGTQVSLQGMVQGEDWYLILLGKEVLALIQAGRAVDLDRLSAGTRQMAMSLAERLDSGLMQLHLRTSAIEHELPDSNGAFLDFDLAPKLDELLAEEPELLDVVAAGYVDYLFPVGSESRIPIVAVTGTNGKTTTSRMVETIARHCGRHTGMACTGGIYFNGKMFAKDGKGGAGRQFRIFEQEKVDFVVMEEYFGSILRAGFAYQDCDVAVCTNVTADHLGRMGVYDLQGLADTKVLAIKRARKAAVLNADNAYSLGMMQDAAAEFIGLVSLQLDAAVLQDKLDRPGRLCVLEDEWLVIYEGTQRNPLMPVGEIPATFNGTAAHNTCNAMQAALACTFMGFKQEQIRAALAGFTTDYSTAPGRLNLMAGLPFQFIMDYAHNLDGYRALCEFVDQIQVSGRKMICVAASGDRQDKEIREAITFLANHFDFFICRPYRGLRGRQPGEIPNLIKRCLTDSGVPETAIQLEFDANGAVESALQAARPGDLLVVLSGSSEFKRIWASAEALKVDRSA